MAAAKKTSKRKLTLRDAQKAHTRQCILDAAQAVFYRDGYYGATIDRIVVEAGASRPTFYLHFKDKEEILRELIAAYVVRGTPYMERLPGPRPTVDQITAWLVDYGRFLKEEQALYAVLAEVSGHQPVNGPHYGLKIMDIWIRLLGRQAPAFAAAASGTDVNAYARARLLVIGLAWAGGSFAADQTGAFTRETVSVVATAWTHFLNDRRFHGTEAKRPRNVVGTDAPSRRQVKGQGRARVISRAR